jgi:hypothetical protein
MRQTATIKTSSIVLKSSCSFRRNEKAVGADIFA